MPRRSGKSKSAKNRSDLSTYRVGDKSGGTKIAYIYGASHHLIVFRDAAGDAFWETTGNAETPVERHVHATYDTIFAAVAACDSRKTQTGIKAALARALFHAMGESDIKAVKGHFAAAKEMLAEQLLFEGRQAYVLSAAAVAAVAAAIAASGVLSLDGTSRDAVVRGVLMGCLGALTSVVQRAGRLQLRPFQPKRDVSFQGVTRVVLGAIFAYFAIVATRAELILGIAHNSPWAMSTFCFIAGISERFVPELINGLSKVATASGKTDGDAKDKASDDDRSDDQTTE